MAIPVSDKELALWIKAFNERCGYSPTVREICEAFGWRSASTGHIALNRAIKNGFVSVEAPQRRRKLIVRAGL